MTFGSGGFSLCGEKRGEQFRALISDLRVSFDPLLQNLTLVCVCVCLCVCECAWRPFPSVCRGTGRPSSLLGSTGPVEICGDEGAGV